MSAEVVGPFEPVEDEGLPYDSSGLVEVHFAGRMGWGLVPARLCWRSVPVVEVVAGTSVDLPYLPLEDQAGEGVDRTDQPMVYTHIMKNKARKHNEVYVSSRCEMWEERERNIDELTSQ